MFAKINLAEAVVLGILLLIAVGASVELSSLHREQRRMLAMLRAGLRNRSSGDSLRLRSTKLRSLWQLVQSVLQHNRLVDAHGSKSDEVLALGKRLVATSDEISKTAKAVGEYLFQRAAPQISAVAVLFQEPTRDSASLQFCRGVPESRMSNILGDLYRSLLEDEDSSASWGYAAAKQGSQFDLSTFGIGMTLSLPLRNSGTIRGMLWLGFQRQGVALSQQQLEQVGAAAEYCAASFETAERIRGRIEEREQQRNFLLGMSHDLRSPGIGALYSVRDLLSEAPGALTTEQVLRLRIIEESLEDQLDMLGDVLDFARHQKGLLTAQSQILRLQDCVSGLLGSFSLQAERKNIRAIIDVVCSRLIVFDPLHLRRIVSNLLSNAVKYTDVGEIRVAAREESQGLLLSVEDSGPGIPENERHLLFQEFARLGHTKHKPGAGLGLVVAQALANSNRTELSYQSSPQGGSLFSIVLPWGPTAEASVSEPAANRPSRSILLVDDDHAVCRTNQRYLEDSGTKIYFAHTEEQALEALERHRLDMVVTDYYLKQGPAVSLIEKLTAVANRIPSIILSGSSQLSGSNRFKSDPRLMILEKPVAREQLRAAVARLCPR